MKQEKITFIGIWLVVITTIYLFYRYFKVLDSIGKMIISIVPSIIFFAAVILFFNRDQKRVKKGKEKDEFIQTRELNLLQELKHDTLTYLIPFIIIILPLVAKLEIGIIDITQAIVAFFALIYLKIMYWKRI